MDEKFELLALPSKDTLTEDDEEEDDETFDPAIEGDDESSVTETFDEEDEEDYFENESEGMSILDV